LIKPGVWFDTAAIVFAWDLVISADTALAPLVDAPTWLLFRCTSDWRLGWRAAKPLVSLDGADQPEGLWRLG
jgi:hypothetical protein